MWKEGNGVGGCRKQTWSSCGNPLLLSLGILLLQAAHFIFRRIFLLLSLILVVPSEATQRKSRVEVFWIE